MPNYLGQHFLKNPMIAKKIIAAADIAAGDTIVEIGSGRGALTRLLAEACGKAGATLIAIEKDEKLASNLEAELTGGAADTATRSETVVKIIRGDALEILKSGELQAMFPNAAQPLKIVGNIPYYITGHLFRIISELAKKPARAVFMVQREVAERIVAAPPKMNRLAASVQFWAEPKIIAHAPKEDFAPAPKVDSAVITLVTRQPEASFDHAQQYYAVVRALFAQPRKTILNNLSATQKIGATGADSKAALIRKLSDLGITSGLRPQNLTIKDIDGIAAALR